jgi:hypothetical protein
VSLYTHSSDGIGDGTRSYHVAHAPKLRKQWMLMVHTPGMGDIAAYFRDEEQARTFAATFGLTITDHQDDAS